MSDSTTSIRSVFATFAGVTLLGTVTDHDGRSGIGIGRVNGDGEESEYIFDPHTGALLGEEDIGTRADAGYRGATAGTVLDWAVYLSSGIVNSLSDTPSGPTTPAPAVSCVAVPGHPYAARCTPA